jgi:hypothetical protein
MLPETLFCSVAATTTTKPKSKAASKTAIGRLMATFLTINGYHMRRVIIRSGIMVAMHKLLRKKNFCASRGSDIGRANRGQLRVESGTQQRVIRELTRRERRAEDCPPYLAEGRGRGGMNSALRGRRLMMAFLVRLKRAAISSSGTRPSSLSSAGVQGASVGQFPAVAGNGSRPRSAGGDAECPTFRGAAL